MSGIYIQRNVSTSSNNDGYYTGTTYADSTNYSFASAGDITQATVPLTIKIMGNIVDYDRPFVLKVDESKSTAIRGTHFDYDENACVMPANAAQTTVPVTLFRHADLTTAYYRVEFFLEANEFFTLELEQYKNTDSWTATGDTLCGTRYAIRFSEILTNEEAAEILVSAINTYGTMKTKRSMLGILSGVPVEDLAEMYASDKEKRERLLKMANAQLQKIKK